MKAISQLSVKREISWSSCVVREAVFKASVFFPHCAQFFFSCPCSLLCAFVFWKVIFGKLFSKLSCICLPLEKLVNGKHFLVNGKHFPVKFDLIYRKVFSFYFRWKTLSGSYEKFKMLYYLLIISYLVLKLLIAIYILFWIFFFNFIP